MYVKLSVCFSVSVCSVFFTISKGWATSIHFRKSQDFFRVGQWGNFSRVITILEWWGGKPTPQPFRVNCTSIFISILTPAFYDSLCSSRHKRHTDDRDFKNVLQDPVYGLKVRCSFNKTWCPCV